MSFAITLPMPPSVNHYWRHGRNGTYISAEGKAYRAEVLRRCKSPVVLYPHQRLAVTLTLHANSRPTMWTTAPKRALTPSKKRASMATTGK